MVKMLTIIQYCARSESEVRRISSFVLAKGRGHFATKFRTNTRELSLNDTKFRVYVREISGERNLADTVYKANRLNLLRTLKPALL